MNTEPTSRTINEMRIDAYARIAEACMVHGLPAPLTVNTFAHQSLHIRVDDDRPEQADAWAEFLGQPAPTDQWVRGGAAGFIDHGSRGGGRWRGWLVTVWCAVRDPEQIARLSALATLGA